MSIPFMPPAKSSNGEYYNWVETPPGLEGMIVSLDELNHFFPSKPGESEIEVTEEHDNYLVYGKQIGEGPFKFIQNMAYQCKKCDEIIVGHPIIKDKISIYEESSERNNGHDMYCRNCTNHLKSKTSGKR
jgi:hypothetical protein